MKRLSVTLLAVLMVVANTIFAQQVSTTQVFNLNAGQVAKLDLSGKWTGKRSQYSWDKKSYIEVFEYEFNLKQEGNIITGTSTIINSNGEYADMIIEGVIVGDKLHFAEKAVQNAIRPQGRLWCFKSGELTFQKDGDKIVMSGATPSYMEVYNTECSGGVTNLTKVDNSNIDLSALVSTPGGNTGTDAKINIVAYPNPFAENSNISYNLTADSKVKVEVFDITGRLVTGLFEGKQKSGNYNLNFAAKNYGTSSGIFIVKMVVNGEIYSRQLVQTR